MPRRLWEHQSPELTQMGRFRRALEASVGEKFDVSVRSVDPSSQLSLENVNFILTRTYHLELS